MIDKPIRKIEMADIDALVENQVSEGRQLEFKESLPGITDQDKFNFLKTITALANTLGGDVVYGIAEKREGSQKTGGFCLKGLASENFNYDKERNRLEQMINNKTEPKLRGVEFHLVEGKGRPPLIVVRIPKSFDSPHAVNHDGTRRFFVRGSGGNDMMDVRQLRQAFLASELLPERIRKFREDRIELIRRGDAPAPLEQYAKLVVHIVPHSVFEMGPSAFDLVRSYEMRSELRDLNGKNTTGFRHNLDGWLAYNSSRRYHQVFRNGAIEACDSSLIQTTNFEPIKHMNAHCLKKVVPFVRGALDWLRGLGVKPPISIFISLINMRNKGLFIHGLVDVDPVRCFDRDLVLIPDVLVEEYGEPAENILKPAFDMIWQAAGFPRDEEDYDDNGRWKHGSG